MIDRDVVGLGDGVHVHVVLYRDRTQIVAGLHDVYEETMGRAYGRRGRELGAALVTGNDQLLTDLQH